MPFKPVTVRRWEVGAAFVVLTIAFVVGLVQVNHVARKAHDLSLENQETKATIHQLEITNCGLKRFLLTARHTRLIAARDEIGEARRTDLAAAAGYLKIASQFRAVGAHCNVPVDG